MPATAIPALGLDAVGRRAASIRPRTSAASASSSIAVGGSEAMWRSVWRTTPACSEVWKEISAPVPTISSVEPPPMSTTRVGSRRRVLGGRAEIGEPRLLLAVEDPGREREALAQLGDEGAAVLGVADGAGRDRVDRLGPELLDRRRRTRRSPRRRPRSPRPRAARRGRPRAPAASPCCAARPARPARRRRRRPAAAPSWCRRRSPRPCGSPLTWAGL